MDVNSRRGISVAILVSTFGLLLSGCIPFMGDPAPQLLGVELRSGQYHLIAPICGNEKWRVTNIWGEYDSGGNFWEVDNQTSPKIVNGPFLDVKVGENLLPLNTVTAMPANLQYSRITMGIQHDATVASTGVFDIGQLINGGFYSSDGSQDRFELYRATCDVSVPRSTPTPSPTP